MSQQPQRTIEWLKSMRIGAPVVIGVTAVAAVGALLLILSGTFHAKVPDLPRSNEGRPASNLPQAEVRIVKRARYETAVGSIKPVHESAVASKLLARVVEVDAKAGQAVAQGDLLIRLDDADLQARLEQASAAEAGARARMEQAEADFQRAQSLIQRNAISKAQFDQAAASRKSATSEFQRAQQAVREAQTVLDYATIRAPFSGIVVDKQVESGDTVTPGQVLLTIFDPTRMQMVASVRESLAQRLTVGQTVQARLDALDHDCEATVSEIVPQADTASRSFAVKVVGPCPPGAYSGMFARLLLPLEDEEIVVVPASAVRRVGQLTMVDVVESGITKRRHVQLGRRLEGDVEVLSGLVPAEKVVLWQEQAAR